jgi:hypothetical protein
MNVDVRPRPVSLIIVPVSPSAASLALAPYRFVVMSEIKHVHTVRPIRAVKPLHPIHFLPPEVLAHIFVLGASSTDREGILFPLMISHVCGAWRDLAVSIHCLWRQITSDYNWQISQHYLRHSAACQLDVTLSHGRILDVGGVQWYMHLISPHINRWRSFTVRFDHYAPFLWNSALSSCCGTTKAVQARALEALTLIYPKNDDTKEFTLFGGVAPRLTTLTVVGIRLDWLPSLFQNLKILDYTHHGFTRGHEAVVEFLFMMQTSYRLEELRISFPATLRREEYPYSLPVITLPSLQRLVIRVRNDIPTELTIILGSLQLPMLRSLHLRDTSRSKHPFPSLKAFSRALRRPQSLVLLDLGYGWWEKRFVATFSDIKILCVNGTEKWRQYSS